MKKPNLNFEKKYWFVGKKYICGLDEVGRGCWAGPLYVGAVVFSPGVRMNSKVRDSKLLRAEQRFFLYDKIKTQSLAWGIGRVSAQEIDNLGITKATRLAMERAISQIPFVIDFFLTDSVCFDGYPHLPILKGDEISYTIASASIIAKVERDLYMSGHPLASRYAFDENKGYGTKKHQELIKEHGLSDLHRRSFKPIKALT